MLMGESSLLLCKKGHPDACAVYSFTVFTTHCAKYLARCNILRSRHELRVQRAY